MIDNIIFDFDSTIINAEGVDLILKKALERTSAERRTALLDRLQDLTDKATSGGMPLGEALHRRFELTAVLKTDVAAVAAQIIDAITPMVRETIQQLQQVGKQIYVFSTSFAELVRPVTDALMISWDHVFTNQLIYDLADQVVGFNEKNPLFLSVGKSFVAEQMKNDGRLPGATVVVGDGNTDLALRKSGIAQLFVYFSGSKVQEEIRQQADFSIERFDQLLPLFFSEDEYSSAMAQRALDETANGAVQPSILLVENVHPLAVERFQEAGYPVRAEKKSLSIADLDERGRSVQVLGMRSQSRLDGAAIAALPNLWVVGAFCIGINQIDLDAAARAGVPVFNAPYSNTRSVAELVVGETILLMRRISEKSGAAHRGEWMKSAVGCAEIRGKTVGIVGYGHIGSQVSVLLEQLGMSVLFHDIVDKLPMGNAKRARHLDDLLQRADVVTLHVPDTPDTRNMISGLQLERMKKGSFLINSSRGGVVDIEALHQALQSGHLAGAAIDVFPKEPDHAGEAFTSPLQGAANVILTPHIGGSTEEAQENIAAYVSGKILNFLLTGSTQGAVNFPEVDLPRMPGTHRILHIHKNVPGVLAKINSVFARRNINVESQMLQTHDQIGYLIVDVDHHISGHVLELMRHITETVKIRKIE